MLLCTEGYEAGAPWPEAKHLEYRDFGWPKRSFLHRLWFDQSTVKRLSRGAHACSLYSQLFALHDFPGRQVLNLRNAIYFSERYSSRYDSTRLLAKRLQFKLRRLWTGWSIGQSDVAVAPTKAMVEKARRQVGENGQVWQPVHHGFSREQFFNGSELNERQCGLLDALPSDVPSILFVSPFREHKNVETLFDGFTCYRERGNRGKLVVTFGREDMGGTDGLAAREALARCAYEDDIVFLGRVPWREIWNVYAACDVFVFPSYLESFGFPLVEAMASELPVVAACTEVNREICGDAAVYFDTFNPEDLAGKLETVTGESGLQQQFSAAGLQRSKDFSWNKHVRQIVELLC